MGVRRFVARIDLDKRDLSLALTYTFLVFRTIASTSYTTATGLYGRLGRLRLGLAVSQRRKQCLGCSSLC